MAVKGRHPLCLVTDVIGACHPTVNRCPSDIGGDPADSHRNADDPGRLHSPFRSWIAWIGRFYEANEAIRTQCRFETYDEVIEHLPDFIQSIYNNRRQHSALGYLSP
ncbi:hypothetical protein HJB51_14495 [Rhizobium lentis]|uniref:Integrase catalytic domain-containing protein n=1 Tax=Rhizobium lentis TaxID=1138194 RepID=A0A9Q3QYG8_9HYPH|nr:IS3 family transposase [Rhizobium lentis]MBX5010277.1 hypothetical protein [Rhizobium lentis]MBX5023960.1 hypothetical protein [Rhizobium lentis]MBX5052370.1 hypothetical protein [Rhizobium lentis]MBX5072023.1 hypothetical protein [Rhizobium lentis]MBX5109182.1 hypothetical protein [Rhizobium lentis]